MFDLHNHLLPGLDDGALDWEESLAMARLAAEDGIEGVVCTPHWVPAFFENDRAKILHATGVLREKLAEASIPLAVYPGAELRLHHDIPKKIESQELLTLNDSGRYALIELPDVLLPLDMEHILQDLLSNNVTPIISHPERNPRLIREPARLYRLVEKGCLLQITSSSVLGRFGKKVEKFAMTILKHDWAHVIASDAHGLQMRTPRLLECYRKIAELFSEEIARRLLYENPRHIIEGETIEAGEPVPFGSAPGDPSAWKKIFSFLGGNGE